MAEIRKDEIVEEMSDKNSESSDKAETKAKASKSKAAKPTPQPAPIKPYVHIDTFLQTAIPLFNLSKPQAAGFKALMNGRHYQRDEQVFVDELKKHLNIK